MYLVVIAWLYVTALMAVAEATHSNGSLLGAIFTFFLYGLMPVALLVYFKTRKRNTPPPADACTPPSPELGSAPCVAPDDSGHAPGVAQTDSVAPVRKEM